MIRNLGVCRWAPRNKHLGTSEIVLSDYGEPTCGEFDEMRQCRQRGRAAQELANLVGERGLRIEGTSCAQPRRLHESRIVHCGGRPLQRREDAL